MLGRGCSKSSAAAAAAVREAREHGRVSPRSIRRPHSVPPVASESSPPPFRAVRRRDPATRHATVSPLVMPPPPPRLATHPQPCLRHAVSLPDASVKLPVHHRHTRRILSALIPPSFHIARTARALSSGRSVVRVSYQLCRCHPPRDRPPAGSRFLYSAPLQAAMSHASAQAALRQSNPPPFSLPLRVREAGGATYAQPSVSA